jgi:hypothetical protein
MTAFVRFVVAAMVFVAVVLGAAAADAKSCLRETPLPPDTRITPPAADVPADVARFAGAWAGAFKDEANADAACHTLVVEEVFANGYARVIFSGGPHEPWGVRLPLLERATGRVVDGVLRVKLPLVGIRPDLTYRLSAGALAGTFKLGAIDLPSTLTRVADVGDVGCPPLARDGLAAPVPTAPRDRITAANLLDSRHAADSPVHNDYFMPLGQAAPARHALRGILSISAMSLSSANSGCAGLPMPLPGFSVSFYTHADHLVPVVRTLVPGSRGTGVPPSGFIRLPSAIIVSPGRVWAEPGDQGLSRASFPFVFVNEADNATQNGLATFLFDDSRVSNLRVQITQETAAWARHDFWGQVAMTYAPTLLPGEAASRASFDAERRLETPLKPWSALPASARSPWLDAFDGDARPGDISANGLVVDGVLYLKGCPTRTGPYPYCRHMRHGVFSVTKSLGAGVALLRLAQKYGDGVFDLKIADYVTVTAAHDGWKDVTFADALGMAAPIGDLGRRRDWPDPEPDDKGPKLDDWMEARTAQAKLARAFSYGRYSWSRGEVIRYNSTVTFVLASAMDAFLKRRGGPSAHLWDMVAEEVFRPIGILHLPTMHTVETDGSRGIPILAYGLYPTIDDIAKLTMLLQNGGRHDGRQILSATKVADALRQTSATGLPTLRINRFGGQRYHLSFWSVPYRTDVGCLFDIPFMGGFGGNLVALLPNGISAFRFADGFTYDLESMILAGEAIRPFCTSAPTGAAAPAEGRPMSAAEVAAELPGNTFASGGFRLFIAPGGMVYSVVAGDFDVGRWRITPEGLYCRAWNVADRGRDRCYGVRRDGETFSLYVHDRWTMVRLQRIRGKSPDF